MKRFQSIQKMIDHELQEYWLSLTCEISGDIFEGYIKKPTRCGVASRSVRIVRGFLG